MRYKVAHTTTYTYSEPAALSQNDVCLFPRDTARQVCMRRLISVEPEPSVLDSGTDYFGNFVHTLMVQEPHEHLRIHTDIVLDTHEVEEWEPEATPAWEDVLQRLRGHSGRDELAAYEFIFPSPFIARSQAVEAYARECFPAGTPILEGALELTRRIFTEFSYSRDATNVDTPVEHVLATKQGVCQDFAHLAISCLRSLGLAARYVSGYLETLPPPGRERLTGADASHAWVSVYVPDMGWVDLDPTNGIVAGERHITVGWGRDYGDVTPVKGVIWGGGVHDLQVAVDVVAVPVED